MKKTPLPDAIGLVRRRPRPVARWIYKPHEVRSINPKSAGYATRASPTRLRASKLASPSRLLPQEIQACRHASTSSDVAPLKRTALYNLHLGYGAKMVPFAGYSMPVQYSDLSVGESHKWTREKTSLFDVGHMVQHTMAGPPSTILLEMITPTSLHGLEINRSTLSCLLHPKTGGIVDDTVITRIGKSPDKYYIVTNAACRQKDLAYISSQISELQSKSLDDSFDWQVLEGWGLIALQGPLSVEVLQQSLAKPETIDLHGFYFGQSAFVSLLLPSGEHSELVLITRGGYTGEDGFEISIPPNITVPITQSLLRVGGPARLRLAGLGARDSLRLEAGMCLYGHDLDDTTTPVEAGLRWIISEYRREAGGFHGDNVILPQMKTLKNGGTGVTRRRVGLMVEGAPAREGSEIVVDSSEGQQVIGRITSGCPSPTLGKNIAMGYIKEGYHKAGTEVGVIVRGKRRKAEVTKMPFVTSKYWKQAAGTAPA